MYKFYSFVISIALLLTSVCESIKLNKHDQDKPLTTTTQELLSSFKQCIIFTFDWAFDHSDPSTSTDFFIFYSKSINCAVIRDTCMWNKTVENPRFKTFKPHPLFTRYATTLINLYSSAAASINPAGIPATAYIPKVISVYNLPFNYILLFMSKERFSSVDMGAMFTQCLRACAPAVYILILDEQDVSIVGFAQVLQSRPYLFKVKTLQESHFQRLHESVHKDLQHAELAVNSKSSPQVCKLGWKIKLSANGCTLGSLIKNYNMTYRHCVPASCPQRRIIAIKSHQELRIKDELIRRSPYYCEFINYFWSYYEFRFTCIVETGSKSFMAFVQAFDLSTWIVTVVACMGLSITVAAISTKKESSVWAKLKPSAVVVLMLLFDRFYIYKKLELAASKQTVLVLTLWAFGAMLLGMSYTGKMISELASSSLPPFPQDMHELSLVEYPILTSETISMWKYGKKTSIGHIHNKINRYLEDKLGQNSTLINDLRRLKSTVTLIDKKWLTFAYQPNISRSSSSKVIFAYADRPMKVKAAGQWSGTSRSSLRPSPSRILPFFSNQNHMYLESNSLLPIFRKFLAKICEPGFITYWKESSDAETSRIFIHGHFKIFTAFSQINPTELGESMKKRMNLAAIWRNFDLLLESTTLWSQITLHTLNPAFQLLGMGVLIAALALFHERWPLHVVHRELFRISMESIFCVKKWCKC